jgi:hypothetical protein
MSSTQIQKLVVLISGALLLLVYGCGGESAPQDATSKAKQESSQAPISALSEKTSSRGAERTAQINAAAPGTTSSGEQGKSSSQTKDSHTSKSSEKISPVLAKIIKGGNNASHSDRSLSQEEIGDILRELALQAKAKNTRPHDDPSGEESESGIQSVLQQITGNGP